MLVALAAGVLRYSGERGRERVTSGGLLATYNAHNGAAWPVTASPPRFSARPALEAIIKTPRQELRDLGDTQAEGRARRTGGGIVHEKNSRRFL